MWLSGRSLAHPRQGEGASVRAHVWIGFSKRVRAGGHACVLGFVGASRCAYVCVRVLACVRACMRACVLASVRACVFLFPLPSGGFSYQVPGGGPAGKLI